MKQSGDEVLLHIMQASVIIWRSVTHLLLVILIKHFIMTSFLIWHSSKTFNKMFLFQLQAGLIRNTASEQLIIALEPECASLYCRTIKAHLFDGASGNEAMTLPLGSQYMVLDCGGMESYIYNNFVKKPVNGV